MAKNCVIYDVTHKKFATQNQKKIFSLQTRRLAKSFRGIEQLSSAFGAGGIPTQRHVQTAGFRQKTVGYWL